MVNAGLTPYQALATGTINVAAFFGQGSAAYGQVANGHMADLVLLGGNPLAEISNTRDVIGVMRAGRWFDRAALDQILAQIQQRKI